MPRADGAVVEPRAITSGQSQAPAEKVYDAEIVDENEFTDLDEAEEWVKALYFGIEGTGKTTAAAFMANLPGDGIVVVINAEAGFKKGPLKKLGVKTEYLKIWNPPGDGVMTYEKLEQLYYRLSARLRADPLCIKGVIMDSLTEIVNKILEQASLTMYLREQRNTRKAEEDKRFSSEVTELQDFGLMTSQVRKLVRKFRDLPCHVAFTALEAEGKAEGEFKGGHAAPEMTPKLRVSVLGYVDVALRLTAESLAISERDSETLVMARTKPSGLVRAKDRLGMLPRDMPEPRFDRIVDYTNGEMVSAEDELFAMYAQARAAADVYTIERREKKAAIAKA